MPSPLRPFGLSLLLAGLLLGSLAVARGSARAEGDARQAQAEGRELVEALGCGGCHGGVPGPGRARAAAPALGPSAPALDAGFVLDYLADPRPRRSGIAPTRMPLFDLSDRERGALALYLGGQGPEAGLERARAAGAGADAAEGRRLFGALDCAACHANPDAPPSASAPDLTREGQRVRGDWLRAYLARPGPIRPAGDPPGSGSRMPDFRLSAAEVDAIAAFLMRDAPPDPLPGSAAAGVDAGPDAGSDTGPAPLSPGRERRARWLLDERLACLGCHRLEGEGGALGPPLDGLAERLRPAYLRAMLADPQAAAPGSAMPAQPLNSADADLIARFLLGDTVGWRAPARVAVPVPETAADGGESEPGAALYTRWCAACHGPSGRGDGWNAPSLPVRPTLHGDAAAMGARADDTLYDGIHAGGWVLARSARMPAFGELLTPDQIDALVAHIRRLCACEGPAWSRDQAEGGS